MAGLLEEGPIRRILKERKLGGQQSPELRDTTRIKDVLQHLYNELYDAQQLVVKMEFWIISDPASWKHFSKVKGNIGEVIDNVKRTLEVLSAKPERW